MDLGLWCRNKGLGIPMEVSWFSKPKEGAAKSQKDQDHVNCVFWLGRCCLSWVCLSRPISTSSMFFVKWEIQYDENSGSYGQVVTGSFITTMYPLMHHTLCRVFWWNIKSPRWLSPATSQIWHPATPLKGKRFQTVIELQENEIR